MTAKPNPRSTFTRLAQWCSTMTGRPIAFFVASALILESLSEQELAEIRKDYGHLADLAREHLAQGGSDIDVPEIERGRVK